MQKDHLKYLANLSGLAMLAFWATSRAFGWVVSLFMAFNLPGATVNNPVGMSETTSGLVNLVWTVLALSIPIFIFYRGQVPKEPRISFEKPKKKHFLPLFLLFLGLIPFTNMLSGIIGAIISPLLNLPQAEMVFPEGFTPIVLMVISICVVPAVLEEVIFRGFMQKLLWPYGGAFAIGLSSFLFMMFHAQPAQLVSIFIMSIFLGYSAYVTNSLTASVLFHLANNLTAFLISFTVHIADETAAIAVIAILYSVYIALGIVGLLIARKQKWPTLSPNTMPGRITRAEKVLTAPIFIITVLVAGASIVGWL